MEDKKNKYKRISNISFQFAVGMVFMWIIQLSTGYHPGYLYSTIYYSWFSAKMINASLFFGIPALISLVLFVIFKNKANE